MAVLAYLPWLGSPPLSWLQLAGSACFLTLSGALVAMGWPKRSVIKVSPQKAMLMHQGQSHALTLPLRWRLILSAPYLAPQCRYVAGIESADGTFWELLSGPRPDQVLSDLNCCREVWPLSVSSGWGLHHSAQPWNFGRLTVPIARPARAGTRPVSAPRTDPHLPRVMTVVALGVTCSLLAIAIPGLGAQPYFNIVSLLLPFLLVGQLSFAAFASSARSQLRCGAHTVYLRGGIFGRASRSVPRDGIRGVHLVGRSQSAEVCHLLIDTDYGPLASRVRSEAAEEFLTAARKRLQLPARELAETSL